MVHEDLRGRFSIGPKQTRTPKDPPSSTAQAKEEALARVREDGMALEKCTNKLRGDHEVALAAVQQNGAALRFVHGGLAGKKEFLTEAVRRNPDALEYIRSRELRKEIQRIAAASPHSNGGSGSPTSPTASWLSSNGGAGGGGAAAAAAVASVADKARVADTAANVGPRAPYPAATNGYDRGAGLNGTVSANGGATVAYSGGYVSGGGGLAAQAAAAGAPQQQTSPSTGMRVVVAPFRGASAPGATVLLTLSIGELVEILNRDSSGWTYGRKMMAQAEGPLEGWFPDWCA